MKRSVSRFGCTVTCAALSLALGCSCAVLPPASNKPASSSASVPTDAEGKPLYDASRLDDGKLRALYTYDSAGNGTTILCGSKVLYQAARSENVSLVQDTITGETNYWFRSWSDPTGRGGRRSALYDKDGTEVMAFDGEQSATLQNGLLILQESPLVDGVYSDYAYGTCQVIDLATGESLPVPDGAYGCIVCGDVLVFNCYARPADLAADEWDDNTELHSWVIIQQKDGTELRRVDTARAMNLFYAPDVLDGWAELDAYSANSTAQTLYSPSTGEELAGFQQLCGSGTAAFRTSGGYELRDLTAEDRGVISTFDGQPTHYFPGYVVTWNVDSDYSYSLHDLSTGEVTPLYTVSLTGNQLALYAQDGSLKVYDTDTGKLLTDTNAGTLEDGQRVSLDCEGDGYVWLELRNNDTYEITAVQVYGSEGLVSDLSDLTGTYDYLGYLTTDKNGRPLYSGTRSAAGSSYGTVCDVLDENGNVVMKGLGSCYGFYSNSLNALPEHVFTTQRGFYYGWMDTDGSWLYCQSVFSTINADDEMGY